MIVLAIDDLTGTDRDVRTERWRSRRLLRRDDGMNYSLHWTELRAGTELEMTYEHHLEANLCVAGEGDVVDLATGAVHAIRPGVMYALDRHDHHLLRATTDMQLVCVFWPALSGDERHNRQGGYDAPGS